MKLYGYWRSSSSWRVRIALNLKGVEYEYVPVHLVRDGGEQHHPEYVAKNALHQVPTLEHDGVVLTQSMAMVEWLDEIAPEPRLFPGDAQDRARIRELCEISNSAIQPMHNLSVLLAVEALGAVRAEWARPHIERGLAAMEERVSVPFAAGADLSAADVFIVPQLGAARRFGVDVERFVKLIRIESNCKTLPAFERAHPDQQPDAQQGA